MNSPDSIPAYLAALKAQLSALEPADAAEVLREIESHLHEVLGQAQARGEAVNLAAVLQGLGPPEALAAQYVEHIRTGAPPPRGFRVIQRVQQTVTWGLYGSMGAFGFGASAALLVLALAKLLHPDAVGIWSLDGGRAITLTWHGPPDPNAQELLGLGLLPLCLLASLACAELTRRVLRVLRTGMRSPQ